MTPEYLSQQRLWDREYQRRRRMQNKDWKTADSLAYQKLNPEKRAAHRVVYTAIKQGKLIKEPCTRCGLDPAQAHHPDYSKPLEVVWLCPSHHKLEHLSRV